jgi:hypothetical protein
VASQIITACSSRFNRDGDMFPSCSRNFCDYIWYSRSSRRARSSRPKQLNRRYYHTPKLPQSSTHLQSPGSNAHDDSRKATQLSLVAGSSVVGSRGGGGSGRLGGADAGAVRRRGRCGDGSQLRGGCAADRGEDAVTMLEDILGAVIGVGLLTSSERLLQQRGREGR